MAPNARATDRDIEFTGDVVVRCAAVVVDAAVLDTLPAAGTTTTTAAAATTNTEPECEGHKHAHVRAQSDQPVSAASYGETRNDCESKGVGWRGAIVEGPVGAHTYIRTYTHIASQMSRSQTTRRGERKLLRTIVLMVGRVVKEVAVRQRRHLANVQRQVFRLPVALSR